MRGYPGHATLHALREGKIIDLDGMLFVKDEGELAPGDTYIGARNTVDVYTCREITHGAVFCEGFGYAFGIHECVKVRPADDGTAEYAVSAEQIHTNALKAR